MADRELCGLQGHHGDPQDLLRFFAVDGCRLRLGVYESFDTLCIYLESDALGAGPERNYWVKYRIAALNQKHFDRTDWKESSICTKSWNNSVLQLMKVGSANILNAHPFVIACACMR